MPDLRAPRTLALGLAFAFTSRAAFAQQQDDRGASGANIREKPAEEAPKPTAVQLEPPKLSKDSPATYPEQALREHVKETFRVVLIVELDPEGRVRKVTPEAPVGHGFDEAAKQAAEKLEFSPAKRNGTPIAAKIKHVYEFPPPPSRLRGKVRRESDKPIPRAKITLVRADGTNVEVIADQNGDWSVDSLPFGETSVDVAAEGYEPASAKQTIEPGEEVEITLRLKSKAAAAPVVNGGKAEEIEEINVKGERPPREVTKRTLEQRELSRIPGTNGDALRAIQNLPGVARPPGLAGLLLVRGSAPQDTNVFIDGTLVPLVYHFGGLSSVVPTELLDRLDFFPGNFSAQYGRVTGGAVDVAIKDPKKDKLHGLVQFDLIDGRLLAEGPIAKTGWNFAVAGRRSWVDLWLKPVLEATGAGVTAAPVYYDYQAMVSRDWGKKASFRLALFGSDDKLSLLIKSPFASDPSIAGTIASHTGFWRVQARYKRKLTNTTDMKLVTAIGQDFIDFTLGTNYFNLTTYPWSTRFEISEKVDPGVMLNVGLDILFNPYDVAVRFPPQGRQGEPPGGPFLSRPPRVVELHDTQYRPGFYTELEVTKWKGSRILPSMRLDYAKDTKAWDVSPRIAVRQDLVAAPRLTVKGGVGLFYQPPQPQETTAAFGQTGLVSNRALHTSLGVEREFTRNVEVSVEGFYKDLRRLVVPGFKNQGEGYVAGVETLIRYKPDAKFFGWIAYTLSRSIRRNSPDDPERFSNFDQTHILTLLGSYRLGNGWEVGGRFRLVSGNPYTPNAYGFFDANAGVNLPLQTYPPFGDRLPVFHQLDLRVDKVWRFKEWKLSAYLDLQNAYNQGNVEGVSYNYNYTRRSFATGLPILPSLGIRGEL